MLEHVELRIEPLRRGVHGWVRVIRAAATMKAVGYALRVHFGRWFKTWGYTIHEERDGSLLAKVGRRRWLAPMVIADADDRIIARLQGTLLRWRDGRLLGELQSRRTGGQCRSPS